MKYILLAISMVFSVPSFSSEGSLVGVWEGVRQDGVLSWYSRLEVDAKLNGKFIFTGFGGGNSEPSVVTFGKEGVVDKGGYFEILGVINNEKCTLVVNNTAPGSVAMELWFVAESTDGNYVTLPLKLQKMEGLSLVEIIGKHQKH